MSSFTTPLVVSPLPCGRRWRLEKAFVYEIGALGSGNVVNVPKGYITDFASVPRPLWWLFPPWGRYGKAAILHDWCYENPPYSKREADTLFNEAMVVLKVPRWKRVLLYTAVRLFGKRF